MDEAKSEVKAKYGTLEQILRLASLKPFNPYRCLCYCGRSGRQMMRRRRLVQIPASSNRGIYQTGNRYLQYSWLISSNVRKMGTTGLGYVTDLSMP